jgi:hypothetical protein
MAGGSCGPPSGGSGRFAPRHRAAAGAGRFFAYFLIVTGILGMLAGHAPEPWRIFIGLFLLMAAQSAASHVWLKEALSGCGSGT